MFDASEPLTTFNQKLQLIRDRVGSVYHGYQTGCYLVGRPGTSKTFTVKEELDRLDALWVYQNARMTPMGLFDFLAAHPEHHIVLDDISVLFKSDQAMQILMAALDGKPGQVRTITYKSKDKELRESFSGSIIAISNVPLRHDPLADALQSRIVILEHEPTDEEIMAFIRHLAVQGTDGLTTEECQEVAEFVIASTREFDLRLDLRHVTKGWQDFRQDKEGLSQTPWRDLVRSSLRKPIRQVIPLSKREDILRQRERVREAMRKHPDDSQAQIEASGLSKSTFYERRSEVLAESAA